MHRVPDLESTHLIRGETLLELIEATYVDFRRLLERERGAYWTYCFFTGDRYLVGASPERLVSLRGCPFSTSRFAPCNHVITISSWPTSIPSNASAN